MSDVMLYRGSEKPNAELGGRKLAYRVVAGDDVEGALSEGWSHSPDEAEHGAAEPALLDRNAKDIEAALPGLTDEELLATLDAETAGKTRKGVIAAIEAEVAARQSKD